MTSTLNCIINHSRRHPPHLQNAFERAATGECCAGWVNRRVGCSHDALELTVLTCDSAEWTRALGFLLERLHDIVFNEFPIPSLPVPPILPSTIDPEVVASTPPRIPTSETETTNQELPDAENEPPAGSQSSTKENDAPTELAAGRPPSGHHSGYPGFEISDSQQTEEMPPPAAREQGALPPELLSSYQMSRRILEHDFAESPPYTIQRLAELILRPRKHYRFLPAYLRALDRIVSVSSPVSDFPLPALHSPLNGGFLTNGEAQTNGISERDGLGSDESLGGALLTPIPWLRNQNNMMGQSSTSQGAEGELHSESTETIEGPHGAGSIETVSVTVNGISSATAAAGQQQQQTSSSPIASPTLSEQSDASTSSASSTEAQLREQGGVTQGELLRQEQEAGVVPVNPSGHPMTPRRTLLQGGAAAVGRDATAAAAAQGAPEIIEEEQPHARGPDVIGMEDMGPQPHPSESGSGVLDMEAAVGRGRSKSPQPPPEEDAPAEKKEGQEESSDDKMEEDETGEPGKPGKDPQDVEKEVEKLREAMDREQQAEAKDADGDVIVADVDGKPADEDKKSDEGDSKPDAVDSTTL